jgi:Tol biopolymer transport system component
VCIVKPYGIATFYWDLPNSRVRAVFAVDHPLPIVEIMWLDGSTPAKHFEISSGAIGWTLDSRSILYIKNEGGVSNIWSQPISGGAAKQITHFNSLLIRSFDLSRDGKQLVMDRGTASRDVVLIHDLR